MTKTSKPANLSSASRATLFAAGFNSAQSDKALADTIRKAGNNQQAIRDAVVNGRAAFACFPTLSADAAEPRFAALMKSKDAKARNAYGAAKTWFSRFLKGAGIASTETKGGGKGGRKPRQPVGTVDASGVTSVAGQTAPASVLLKSGDPSIVKASPAIVAAGDVDAYFRKVGAEMLAFVNANAGVVPACYRSAMVDVTARLRVAADEYTASLPKAETVAKPRKSRGK